MLLVLTKARFDTLSNRVANAAAGLELDICDLVLARRDQLGRHLKLGGEQLRRLERHAGDGRQRRNQGRQRGSDRLPPPELNRGSRARHVSVFR